MTRASLAGMAALAVAFIVMAAAGVGFVLGGLSLTGAAPTASPTASPSPTATPSPTLEPTASPSPTPEPTSTPEPTPVLVPAPLTGRPVTEEEAQRHVIAVMVDDHPAARPQSGFSSASVVWQAPAEGGVPRYMLLFQEEIPGNVGPIRSARSYYVSWAAEWRALYAHVGGSPQALATLQARGSGQYVYNADQYRWGTRYFWRIPQRYAPHNVYTDGKHLRRLADQLGAEDGPVEPAWRFAADLPLLTSPRGGRITLTYNYNTVRYDYDRWTNTYLRRVSAEGKQHDADTDERVAPKNVVIMVVHFSALNDGSHKGRLGADIIGSGTAWIATNGKTIKGTWKKTSTKAPTRFYDRNGEPVTLTIGQTFIEVMPSATAVSIKDGKRPLASPMPIPGTIPRPI